jgi:hypothetical protein
MIVLMVANQLLLVFVISIQEIVSNANLTWKEIFVRDVKLGFMVLIAKTDVALDAITTPVIEIQVNVTHVYLDLLETIAEIV